MNPKPLKLNLVRRGVSGSCIMSIDTDLIIEIFSRLPLNSIIRCKGVCKGWHKIISSPNFTQNYEKNPPSITSLLCRSRSLLNHKIADLLEISESGDCLLTTIAPKLPDFVEGISELMYGGSSNGLMCLVLKKQITLEVYICNPITGEFVALPPSEKEIEDHLDWCTWRYQFGFCPSSKTFKVLRLCDEGYLEESLCEIYTVGVDDKWRCLDEFVPGRSFWGHNIFFNGAFHFIGHPTDVSSEYYIYTFHFEEEKVGRITHPQGVDLNDCMHLGRLKNGICLVDPDSESGISVWIMQEYGMEQSWTKQIILRSWFPSNFDNSIYDIFLLEILPNGEILFLASHERCIVSCDPKQKKCAVIKEFTGGEQFHATKFSYSPCFAPLKEVIRNASSN